MESKTKRLQHSKSYYPFFSSLCTDAPLPSDFFWGEEGGGGRLYTGCSFQSPTVLFALQQGAFVPCDRFVQRTHLSCKYFNAYMQTSSDAADPVGTTLTTPIPRLYKLTNSVSLTGFAPCAIPTGNLVVSFWQLKYSVIPIWLTQRRDMKLFSCKKTENQSHHNQSLISCGHCVRRKWDY